jgi:ABC-type transport system involved in cytochrome c biogenesis permease subunit
MKKIYQGILFVAFLLVAIYGVGGSEGGSFVVTFFVLLGIMALMAGSGMIAKPVSKEEYDKYYGEGKY